MYLATVLATFLALVTSVFFMREPEGIATDEVSFDGAGGITLRGTVITPSAPPTDGGYPAMALVHGSGPGAREQLLPVAEVFARHGIATVIYDKRTEGYSQFERDYSLLADDAVAAVQVLRNREDLDQDRIGVWGLSEGGWVAPLAASRSDDVDFLITVAANGGPPVKQEQWSIATRLDRQGVRGSLARALSLTWLRLGVGTGLFAEAFYDPVPVLRETSQPVLALWGEYDLLTPAGESLTMFHETFESSGHPSYNLRVIPDAEHNLYQTPDQGLTRGDEFAPEYVEIVANWVADLKNGPTEPHADPASARRQ